MKVIADLHIHSRFSRACSNKINPVSLEKAAKLKGINLISTGDFLHKDWLLELKQNLVKDNESGFYKIKNSNENIKFVLGTEISTFFWEKSKSKRIHTCVLIKNIESIEQIRDQLSKFGHIDADGRPILSISTSELMDILLNIEKNAFIFPAHIWTPFFGALGDMSGFNSIKEAYQDQEKHIYALETGLSSDPIMNWRVSQLDKYALISNSDAHSLDKIGREANVFNVENFSYDNVINAIKEKNIKKFEKTIEFYPEEGKYHFDGHRQCNFSLDPQNENNEICPICKKQLVIGVLHRVNELADRPVGFIPKNSIPYEHQIPLKEIISIVIKKGVNTQGVEKKYNALIQEFGTEFNALNSSFDAISKIDQNIAEAIEKIKKNEVKIIPGYDGVFGKFELL
ncbi:MAG: endonuclease Q family protein [Candidatus Marsarchaeota archaeon]|nr:endonuclease Q family protein [Candidatus Marsarchaeota archaeon]MCL5094905.1 endonuclease Q family protein [Candidatus Marsarchaeota archaeon]